MRRAALGIVLGAGLLLPAGAAHAAVGLAPTGDTRFPERAFVLTLPKDTRLAPGDVSVTENGGPVHGLRTAPVGARRRATLGVVLAIDASSSMRGDAYEGALEAARVFAEERNPKQPFAIVTFGSESKVLLPFTTLDGEIQDALDSPGTPSGGTHMYDATLRAVQLVKKSGLRGGFIVVLSDGTDHGSSAGTDEVVAAARAAHVRIYSVGLQSPVFDQEALQALAETGGGEYSEATSAGELEGIYRALGAQLSNAHVLSYRSLVRPGQRVDVRATVAGLGSAAAAYTAPKLRLAGVTPPPKDDEGAGWDSSGARIALFAIVVLLLTGAFALALRSRRRTPRDRVSLYVRKAGEEPDEEERTLTGRLAAHAERSLASTDWWGGFATSVEVAAVQRSAGEVVVISAIVALSLAVLVSSVTGSVVLGLLAIVIVAVGEWVWIRARMRRERRLFADQLADHLAVVGGSLRVGHSLPGALNSALEEAADPTRREFARAVADERLGMPLEEALQDVAARMDNREVEHVALLAKLQREAGADAAEMVDQVVSTVRERQELRRMVRTLTAQGRLSQLVLSFLPLGSLVFLTIVYGDYVDPLYNTAGGHLVLALAAVLVIVGSLVIRRIVTFRV
jgi:tight adherence protein B